MSAGAPAFRVRALEMHSRFVWDFDRVRRSLDFIAEQGMTALVLHRNDIVDRIVWPGRYFGAAPNAASIFERYRDSFRTLYRYTPTRRSGPYHRREYLRRVVELAARQGTEVWFQNKELFFHEIFLELRPELTKGGALCPNEPFWFDFVETKYVELFQELPGLAGVVTAPGTGESRLSITANRCRCELCAAASPRGWYSRLIAAMHRPIAAAGKSLVIRDFVFSRRAQEDLAAAFEAMPADIAVSLKNTPHDYYPSFPDNPRIGRVGARRQWLEFDCMGQYFGWGIAPAILIEDWRGRLDRARAAGVDGLVFRTDWESLDSHSAFHTPNMANLHAGAMLGRDPAMPAAAIYAEWMARAGMLDPDTPVHRAACGAWAERLLGRSWDAVGGTLYARGCVLNDSSTLPVGFDHAWWLAEEKNSLADWDPSKSGALAPTAEALHAVLTEREEALAIHDAAAAALDDPPSGLRTEALDGLRRHFAIARRYLRGFAGATRALTLARFLSVPQPEEAAREARARLEASLAELLDLAAEFRAFEATDLRPVVYTLLSAERLLTLHDDLVARLSPRSP
ncbi:hypothetical protein [Falsiroseomonas oryzae]|uniref:hypothetical protein n=1 Tax=Falsiroseomonas oryzae TaxID=2766473 RepID=UPI0022EB4C9C|nr:hypothetical protein [Roseomonas sp. MO-31]